MPFATSARDGVRNVGALLARIEVRALDAINSRGDSRALDGDPIVGDILFQRSKPAPAPLWRSVLSEAVGKTPFPQAPVDQWKAWLNANAAKLGVKKDEIEWSGITDWLDLQQGKVSREQVQQYLAQNGVKVTGDGVWRQRQNWAARQTIFVNLRAMRGGGLLNRRQILEGRLEDQPLCFGRYFNQPN